MNSFTAIALICLVSLSASAYGLNCIVCAGNSCGDPYTPIEGHKTNCTPDIASKSLATLKSAANKISSALDSLGVNTPTFDVNAKMVCAKLELKSGDIVEVTRSCAMMTDKIDICESLKSENTKCSSCDSDYCNSAPAAHLSIALLSVSALLLASFAR